MLANRWLALGGVGLTVAGLGLFACGHAAPTVDNAAAPTPTAEPSSAPASVVDAALAPTPSAAVSPALDAGPAPAASGAKPSAPVFDTQGPSYPAEALREVFAKNEAKFRACFEPGRKRDPKLRGHVNIKFAIGHDGRVTTAQDQDSNLPDDQVIACVAKLVKTLRFPKPEEGSVTVVYPFIFHPTDPILILPDTAAHK
jgi:hypothetical protein